MFGAALFSPGVKVHCLAASIAALRNISGPLMMVHFVTLPASLISTFTTTSPVTCAALAMGGYTAFTL